MTHDVMFASKTCPMCNVQSSSEGSRCSACGYLFGLINLSRNPEPREAQPLSVMCVQHPEVASKVRCKICLSGVCETCEFVVGGVSICPACIDRESTAEISPKRRNAMIVSYILGIGGLLLLIAAKLGIVQRTFGFEPIVPQITGVIILFMAMGGSVLGFTAHDKKLKNSGATLGALIVNLALLGIYVLLAVFATVRK